MPKPVQESIPVERRLILPLRSVDCLVYRFIQRSCRTSLLPTANDNGTIVPLNLDHEGRALVRFTLEPDISPGLMQGSSGNRQAETQPLVSSGCARKCRWKTC